MRILTVITAIFVPLNFITGLYGMNFDYMPELHARNGFYIMAGVMAGIAVSLLLAFRYKRWL
jgi:magnesium transporter